MTEQEKYDQRCNEISILRAEASRNPELVRANIFYLEHPDFWIHPLAASDEVGDKDRATLRVHLAMAEYARTAELTAYLEACKAVEGERIHYSAIADSGSYNRAIDRAIKAIRSLTRFAELQGDVTYSMDEVEAAVRRAADARAELLKEAEKTK